jgi:hypothetical protein
MTYVLCCPIGTAAFLASKAAEATVFGDWMEGSNFDGWGSAVDYCIAQGADDLCPYVKLHIAEPLKSSCINLSTQSWRHCLQVRGVLSGRRQLAASRRHQRRRPVGGRAHHSQSSSLAVFILAIVAKAPAVLSLVVISLGLDLVPSNVHRAVYRRD